MTKLKLRLSMAMMADRDNASRDVAAQLGVSLSTFYAYVDARGQAKPRALDLLAKRPSKARGSAGEAGRPEADFANSG